MLDLTMQFNNVEMIDLIDRETGYFRKGLQPALRRAHEKMAVALQEAMVEKLEAGQEGYNPTRPQRPGERLKKSLLDARNREVGFGAFRVGVEKWLLEQSPARLYYRAIESGRAGYTTRAFFTNSWPGDVGAPAEQGRLYGPGVGGPHMRMPQFAHAFTRKDGVQQLAPQVTVKAFPGYHYFSVVPAAFGRMNVAAFYRAEGVPIEAFRVAAKK